MDPDAAGIARDHHAVGLVERAPGLNGAIVAARSVAVARGGSAVLVLPADLPAISAAAVDDIIETAAAATDAGAGNHGLVALVPDRHGSGTNVLLVSPPSCIEPAFGVTSLDVHRNATRAAGATLIELDGPLSLDVDTADDLNVAEAALGAIRG
jgi:2-phospho-L-lactate guanylyltransferase